MRSTGRMLDRTLSIRVALAKTWRIGLSSVSLIRSSPSQQNHAKKIGVGKCSSLATTEDSLLALDSMGLKESWDGCASCSHGSRSLRNGLGRPMFRSSSKYVRRSIPCSPRPQKSATFAGTRKRIYKKAMRQIGNQSLEQKNLGSNPFRQFLYRSLWPHRYGRTISNQDLPGKGNGHARNGSLDCGKDQKRLFRKDRLRSSDRLSLQRVCLLHQDKLLLLLNELLLSHRRLIFRFPHLQFPGFGQSFGVMPGS